MLEVSLDWQNNKRVLQDNTALQCMLRLAEYYGIHGRIEEVEPLLNKARAVEVNIYGDTDMDHSRTMVVLKKVIKQQEIQIKELTALNEAKSITTPEVADLPELQEGVAALEIHDPGET